MHLYLHFFYHNFKSRSRLIFRLLVLMLILDYQILVTICEYHTPVLQRNENDESSSLSNSYWPGGERCGTFQIPFPFCLNTKTNSCSSSSKWSGSLSDAFRLSCLNSTSLFLNIGSQSYRVLYFFPDGVLVNFPDTSYCRRYYDINSFTFAGDQYFGISTDNVVALYDCHDSSLCKTDCKESLIPGCDHDRGAGVGTVYPACCCPLSDRSAWHVGESDLHDGFSVFSKFGCRGFSSWVVFTGNGSRTGMRGIKLEWAIPRNSTKSTCASYADAINATSVRSGMRCQCREGFVGDGFAFGLGCFKSCLNNGKEARGKDCYTKSHLTKAEILAGVLTSAFTIASLVALFCLLKRHPINKSSSRYEPDKSCSQSTISFGKPCRTRILFTYQELEEATRGFENQQKLSDGNNIKSTLYAGILEDGSRIAVHRVECESERELIQVLSRVEALSVVSHKNMANLLGWSTDSGYTPLVVYEYPANGTLREQLLLHTGRDRSTISGLDWFKRLNIVAETASFLAFLQCEISPPIFHCDLQSGCIFLDEEFSVKIAGFEPIMIDSNQEGQDCHHHPRNEKSEAAASYSKSHVDVYNIGLILLEVITGSDSSDVPPTSVLQKIRNGIKLEEVVDPFLYYHEQPPCRREQMEIVVDLAIRCLLFGADGKLGMTDVARELVHITKESADGISSSRRGTALLEETFSNSSLLQMISMSPDSLYNVP